MAVNDSHALVLGASGIIGWAVVNELLRPYPSPSPFKKVTALVNRPLSLEDSHWPASKEGGPKLALASGVNLLCDDHEFEKLLQQKVPDIGTVSHVFYFAFKEVSDPEKEVETNVGMMRRVVRAVKRVSPGFKFFVYPGGTRGYGIYRPGGVFSAPLVESMADNLPEDYAKTVSYPHYRSLLTSENEGADWKWCELCPDAIIGFTPNGSGFSLAGHWAVYLYAYKLVHGEGSEVPYPGTVHGYDALYTETSSSNLARVAVYASLHPEKFHEKIFNVADNSRPGSMRERWPQIANWFGLKGGAPPDSASAGDPKPSDFVRRYQDRLEAANVKAVDIWNSAQLDSYGYWLTFDRHLDLTRLRGTGFDKESDPKTGWWQAFDMFKEAGMIR
ncbi:hypothetical protein BDV96DRAFT_572944 [Lophiotrema nucula]|uniref:PRISE-like Rossmann-fold domain-containing protein n=1 Tax=Lophiotrema nucula TaxID=690887 RepID=A0A6A5ZBI2_9PLEO|nr:hypothetical protein BDV96DRAFT_572944 [Lophiotrema nucula]